MIYLIPQHYNFSIDDKTIQSDSEMYKNYLLAVKYILLR